MQTVNTAGRNVTAPKIPSFQRFTPQPTNRVRLRPHACDWRYVLKSLLTNQIARQNETANKTDQILYLVTYFGTEGVVIFIARICNTSNMFQSKI